MNTERLEHLARWLEGGAQHARVRFDMTTGYELIAEEFNPDAPSDCGAVCCIAGAAVQFFATDQEKLERHAAFKIGLEEDDEDEPLDWRVVFDQAQDLLELSREQAAELFVPGNGGEITDYAGTLHSYNDPAWAARTIRHLIATGEVDWDEVIV